MKKQLIYLLATALLSGMAVSCEDITPDPPPTYFCKSYIDAFIKCDSLSFLSVDGVAIDKVNMRFYNVAKSQENILICVFGDEPSRIRGATNVFCSEKSKYRPWYHEYPGHAFYDSIYAQYDKYIEMIGDTAYNKTLKLRWLRVVCLSALKKVVITADKDFSDNFPAGTDLSPLFYIGFDDVYATVKNDYKTAPYTYQWDNTDSDIVPISYRCLKLSEANLEEYPFIEPEWELCLDAKPEKTDNYTFHVKFTFADGTVLEGDAPAITVKGVN